jgi:hypothetical protein
LDFGIQTVTDTFEKRLLIFSAGRTTTNEELEDMLEQGNPAVFTQVGINARLVPF